MTVQSESKSIKLTILKNYPYDRHLVIGEASIVKKSNGDKTIIMACPKCGTNIILDNHNITWNNDKITVEPSVVCKFPNDVSSKQILHENENCLGHFFIKDSEILELA